MKYRIAVDSGGELPEELRGQDAFVSVPLTLTIGGMNIVDDGRFTQKEIVERIAADP